MTYLQEIEEIIKNHPEIPEVFVLDVQKRIGDWMQSSWATEMDNYILAQKRFLQRCIAE